MAKRLIEGRLLNKHKVYKYTLGFVTNVTLGFFGCLKRTKDKIRVKQQLTSLEMVKKKGDLVYILRKIEEFEKFKSLYFTRQQLELFEYIPRPVVSRTSDFVL